MFGNAFGCKLTLSLSLGLLLSNLPALAGDAHSGLADNSGRQIAYVMPVAPPQAPVSAAPANPSIGAFRLPMPSWFDAHFGRDNRQAHAAKVAPSWQVPRQLEDAADKTVVAADSITRIASKRLADLLAWIGMLMQTQTDAPKATPAQAFMTPQVAPQTMRPIADPGKGTQLVLTSEHRLRTVIGR